MINADKRAATATAATLTLTALIAAGTTAPAARAQYDQAPQVTVNESPVSFPAQQPTTQGGRVLVPLRGVLEKLGAYVTFDPRTQTVVALRGSSRITLPIGGRQAVVDNRAVALDVPAQLVNGTTLVPLRFVAESLGAQVRYNAGRNLVAINTVGGGGTGTASSAVQPAPPSQTYNPPAPANPAPTNPAPATGETYNAAETSVSGTVVSVFDELNPPRLVVRVLDPNGRVAPRDRTFPLRGDVRVSLRRDGDAGDRPIAFRQVRPGDRVNVLLSDGAAVAVNVDRVRPGDIAAPATRPYDARDEARRNAGVVRGEFGSLRGGEDGRQILRLSDGREVEIERDTPAFFRDKRFALSDLRPGDGVTIRIDPTTGRGRRVTVGRAR